MASDQSGFALDFETHEATCPQGHKSVHWLERTDQHGHPNLLIRFDQKTCRECPCRSLCTRAQNEPRLLTIRSKEEYLQLQWTRELQEAEEFRVTYALRAGIEGTHSKAGTSARITPITLYWFAKGIITTFFYCCSY
jgi:transposase